MQGPKVSIIIPVYRAELYLSKCIDSVLAQTMEDFEVILVDDGSPDLSGEICDSYAQRDSRVKVIHKKNSGVSSARNEGIINSKGQWICFVDSDDLIENNFLSAFNLDLNDNITDLYVQGYKIVINLNQIIGIRTIGYDKNFSKEEAFIKLERSDIINSPVSKLFRKKIIDKNEIKFDSRISYGEDHLFVLNYLKYCNNIKFVNNTGYLYIHQNINSLTQRNVPIQQLFYYLKSYSSVLHTLFKNNTKILKHSNHRKYSIIKRIFTEYSLSKNSNKEILHTLNKTKTLISFSGLNFKQRCIMYFVKFMPLGFTKKIFKIIA